MVMAQAARLNLRLQKEIKLLLTDPPHGAIFPSLSPLTDSDSPSSSGPALTSIDAQIQGPEGTVYEKGVFKLKIQIPERYPFQPPIVMFVTPIYHPNIDIGGRICLDILNLPPKGAWQPSLNISTVLTSLGLLLSEPNPDDGLMQEASREHKYNRQAFDQKARTMTDKYACAGSLEMARSGTSSDLNKELNENMECMMSMKAVCEESINCRRTHGVSNKLSLGASETDKKEADHDHDLPTKKIKGLLKESNLTLTEHNSQTYKNLQFRKNKPVENSDSLIEGKEYQHSLHLETVAVLNNSSKCLSLGKNGFKSQQNHYGVECNNKSSIMDDENSIQITEKADDKKFPEEICKYVDNEGRKGFSSIRHKKLGLTGRRLPLEKLVSLERNLRPLEKLESLERNLLPLEKLVSLERNDKEELETKKSDEKFVELTEKQETTDSVVVLDSEESEDEKVVSAAAARSKLSLARRPLPGKRKL